MPAYAGVDVRSDVYLGSWTQVPATGPGSVRNTSPVTITRGRPNLRSQASPSSASFTVDNRDFRWTLRNPTSPWYGQLVQNTPIRFSVPSSLAGIPAYMRLETDNASYASAPDSGSFSTPAVVHATPFSQYQTSATVSVTIPSTTAHNCLVIAANLGNSGA